MVFRLAPMSGLILGMTAWSSRGEHLGLYVSRQADGFVLVRCRGTRSLLITPERPSAFVAALSS